MSLLLMHGLRVDSLVGVLLPWGVIAVAAPSPLGTKPLHGMWALKFGLYIFKRSFKRAHNGGAYIKGDYNRTRKSALKPANRKTDQNKFCCNLFFIN